MASLEKCNASTSMLDSESRTNSSIALECNICLDLVQDPVVTFCGHLYCWPCIYQWISFRHVSPENRDPQQPLCPVCKAEVSQKTLVPLYGRGQNTSKNDTSRTGLIIPQRPAHHLQPQHTSNYYTAGNGAGGSAMQLDDPMIGMLGEMVFARFGNSQTTLYSYPNSYHITTGSSSPGLTRHMMQTDQSLSRICFFLCCCVVLCLLLF